MKKLTFTSFLILLIAANPLIAQVKKAPTKPAAPAAVAKPKPAAVKIPVLTKLDPFTKTPDDLVQFLNDEFKKLNHTLKDINETPTHLYEGTKQLDGVLSTSRQLVFDNDIMAIIAANTNEKITELEIEVPVDDTVCYKAISDMLSFAAWPIIARDDDYATYKSGNIIAYAGTEYTDEDKKEGYHQLSLRQITPYTHQPKNPVAFNAKALRIDDNIDDVGYGIVKLLEGLGYDLLYKQAQSPVVEDNKLKEYSTYYQFKNAVSVEIETTAFKKLKLIDIDTDDPISFLKIKKALGVTGWKMYSKDEETKSEFYEYNNIKCLVSGETKGITFIISPDRTDIASRLLESDVPSLEELMDIYLSGKKEQVLDVISSNYVNDFYIPQVYYMTESANPPTIEPNNSLNLHRFLIRTDNGKVPALAGFVFGLGLPDNIRPLFIHSRDEAYLKRVCEEFQKSKYKDKYSCGFITDSKDKIYALYVEDIELNKQRDALRGNR